MMKSLISKHRKTVLSDDIAKQKVSQLSQAKEMERREEKNDDRLRFELCKADRAPLLELALRVTLVTAYTMSYTLCCRMHETRRAE